MFMDCGDKRPRPASFPTMHSESFLSDDDVMQTETSPHMLSVQGPSSCLITRVDTSPPTMTINSLSRPHLQAPGNPGSRQRHGSVPVHPVSTPLSLGISSHEHPPMTGMNSVWPKPVASTCPVTPLNLMTTAANTKPLSPRAIRRRPSKSKTKRLKYHEYRPPQQGSKSQPSTPKSVPSDSSYSRYVQQQTLLLQWQLLNQIGGPTPNAFTMPIPVPNQKQPTNQPNQQLILPAPPRMTEMKKNDQFFPTLPPSAPLVPGTANHIPIESIMDLQKMSISELKSELLKHNLPVSGKKAILIERLKQHRDGKRLQNFSVASPMEMDTVWQGPISPPSVDDSGPKRDRPPSAPPLLDASPSTSGAATNSGLVDIALAVPGVNDIMARQMRLNQGGQPMCRPVAIRPNPQEQQIAALNLLVPQRMQEQQRLLDQLQAQLKQTQQQLEEHKMKRFELENELEQQKHQQHADQMGTDHQAVAGSLQQGDYDSERPPENQANIFPSSPAPQQLTVGGVPSFQPGVLSPRHVVDDAAAMSLHLNQQSSPRRQVSAPALSPLATGPACVQQFVQKPSSYNPPSPPSMAKVRSSSSATRLRSVSMPSSPAQSPRNSPHSSHQNLSTVGLESSTSQPLISPINNINIFSNTSHTRHLSCPDSPSKGGGSSVSQLTGLSSSCASSPSNSMLSGSPRCSSMINLSPTPSYETVFSSSMQTLSANGIPATASLPSLLAKGGSCPPSQPSTPPMTRRSLTNLLRQQSDPPTPIMRSSSLTAADGSSQASPFLSADLMGTSPVLQARSMSFSGPVGSYEDAALPVDLSVSAGGKASSLDDFLASFNRENDFGTEPVFGNSPTASSFGGLPSNASPSGQVLRSSSATQLFLRPHEEGTPEPSLLLVPDTTSVPASLGEPLSVNLGPASPSPTLSPTVASSLQGSATGANTMQVSAFASGSKDNLSWLDLSTMGQGSPTGTTPIVTKHSMHGSVSMGQLATYEGNNDLDVFAATASFLPIGDQWDYT